MAAVILDGKDQAARILARVGMGTAALAAAGKKAVLAAIQANDDAGTDWYAAAQAKHCAKHGIEHRHIRLSANATQEELQAAVRHASDDPEVSGILLFTPLPSGTDQLRLVQAMDPRKDAEGVHPANMGRLLITGSSMPAPCTAMAAAELIAAARPDLSGASALVIGRSPTVGKPLALLLLARHATVTVAHTKSNLREAMLDAEIIVAAAGAAGARWRAYERRLTAWQQNGGDKPTPPSLEPLVTCDLVPRGSIVIDIGDNNVPEALTPEGLPVTDDQGKPKMKYAGDVDFARVSEVAGWITNPRGSVGPLTNAFLLLNTVRAALLLNNMQSDI